MTFTVSLTHVTVTMVTIITVATVTVNYITVNYVTVTKVIVTTITVTNITVNTAQKCLGKSSVPCAGARNKSNYCAKLLCQKGAQSA